MANPMLEMIKGGREYLSFGEALFTATALPYTLLLILVLVGLCVAAFKAKHLVRILGRIAMVLVAIRMVSGIQQFCDCCQWLGVPEHQGGNWFIGYALLPVFSVALIGLIIYIISLLISIAQKPRI